MGELSLGSPSHLRYSQTGDRDRYRGGAMKREVGTPRNGAYLVEAVSDPFRLN